MQTDVGCSRGKVNEFDQFSSKVGRYQGIYETVGLWVQFDLHYYTNQYDEQDEATSFKGGAANHWTVEFKHSCDVQQHVTLKINDVNKCQVQLIIIIQLQNETVFPTPI